MNEKYFLLMGQLILSDILPETEAAKLKKLLEPIFELPKLFLHRDEDVMLTEEKLQLEEKIAKKIQEAFNHKSEIESLVVAIDVRLKKIITEFYDFVSSVSDFREQGNEEVLAYVHYQEEREEILVLILDWIAKAQFLEYNTKQ